MTSSIKISDTKYFDYIISIFPLGDLPCLPLFLSPNKLRVPPPYVLHTTARPRSMRRTKRQNAISKVQVTRPLPPPDKNKLEPLVKNLLFHIGAFGKFALKVNESELCDLSMYGWNNNILRSSCNSINDMIILVHHVRNEWDMQPLSFIDQFSLRREILVLLNKAQRDRWLNCDRNTYSSKYIYTKMLHLMEIMKADSNANITSNIHTKIVRMLQREYGTGAFTSASNDVGSQIEELVPFYHEAKGSICMMKDLLKDYKRSKPLE